MFKSITVRKIAANTVYQFVGKTVTMFVTIAITMMVTRAYGRAGYGEFSLMQTFPALFFIIADFGFNAIAARELTTDWKKADLYFGNILSIRLLLSSAIILFSILGLLFLPYSGGLKFGITLSLLLVLTQALFATTNIIFQVKLRYDLSSIGLISGSILILFLSFIFARLGLNIIWVSFCYVLGGACVFIINILFVKRFGVNIALLFDKEVWKYLFLQSLPLGLMFIFSQINFRSDSILLSVLKLPSKYGYSNTESVALYGLPYKVFEVSLVLPTFFMNSVFPVFVRHMNDGERKLKKTLLISLSILFIAGLLVGILGYFLAPYLITILGGEQFLQSIIVLRILLAGVCVFYLTQPLSWVIVTLGKQIYLPYVYFVSAAFSLLLNLHFIPKYSFYASSVLTWVSEILIFLLLIYFAIRSWNEKYEKRVVS